MGKIQRQSISTQRSGIYYSVERRKMQGDRLISNVQILLVDFLSSNVRKLQTGFKYCQSKPVKEFEEPERHIHTDIPQQQLNGNILLLPIS